MKGFGKSQGGGKKGSRKSVISGGPGTKAPVKCGK